MSAYLQFDSIAKRYGKVAALSGVTLDIERGSTVAVLGPNGAGKSTLFGCLLGTTRPTAGEVRLNGSPIRSEDRQRFGYVAERIALYMHRTVAENVAFFAGVKGCAVADAQRQLERVGLDALRQRKARQLSKGLLQRLGLAIALMGEPELLILDEPFNGLDPALLDRFQAILEEEHARGATLLISTHTMSAVEPLVTHVAIVLDGRLAAFGALEKLREQYDARESLEEIYHRIARRRCAEGEEAVAA